MLAGRQMTSTLTQNEQKQISTNIFQRESKTFNYKTNIDTQQYCLSLILSLVLKQKN